VQSTCSSGVGPKKNDRTVCMFGQGMGQGRGLMRWMCGMELDVAQDDLERGDDYGCTSMWSGTEVQMHYVGGRVGLRLLRLS